MKAFGIILLIVGISTAIIAQQADSIVVSYDNQHTTIPLPAYGKQTTIKMADSVQMIEIGVSRRKLNDIKQTALYSPNTVKAGKPIKKVKWYSQIEAGYTIKFYTGPSSDRIILNGTEPAIIYYNTDNLPGYKLGISIFEKELCFSNKFSYISGFKLGFAQSFRNGKNLDIVQDSVFNLSVGYEPLVTSSLQFLFPFGFRQYIGSEKSKTIINYGSNIGSSIDLIKSGWGRNNIQFSGSPLILQPFIGVEKGKFGVLTTANLSFVSKYDISMRETALKVDYGIGFSLTYRLF